MKIESTTGAQRHNRHLRVFVPSWLDTRRVYPVRVLEKKRGSACLN